MADFDFYVYAYLDPRKPGNYNYCGFKFDYEPFYIGKGKGYRLTSHIKIAFRKSTPCSEKNNKIKKLLSTDQPPIVVKLVDNLSNYASFELEKFLIAKIGRTVAHTGPLSNVYEGGEGSGHMPEETKSKISAVKTGKKLSPEAIENIRKAVTGKKHSEESKEKMRVASTGRLHTDEAKEKMSKAKKGKKLSEEVRRNISKGHIGIHAGDKNPRYGTHWTKEQIRQANLSRARRIWYIVTPTGEMYETYNLVEFCIEHSLKVPSFRSAIEKGRFYKGWLGFKFEKDH